MFNRSHIVSFALATVLASSAWAQTPPAGQGSQLPPDGRVGSPSGSPQGNIPVSPGAVPQDQMLDPYAMDKDFIKSVTESSATEVHLGKIAQDKASSDAVKELGKHMVEAHTNTGQQLKQAAAALNVQVSTEPPRKAMKAEDKLTKLSGADFDRAYIKLAADEQKQTAKQFEREAKNGRVPGIKDFAAKNLSAEQERQKQAEELARAATGTAAR
jgi:putative membrane protein